MFKIYLRPNIISAKLFGANWKHMLTVVYIMTLGTLRIG